MRLQNRELKVGDVLYRGRERYTVSRIYIYTYTDEVFANLQADDGKCSNFTEAQLNETFRFNPYDIPDDPPPILIDELKVGDIVFDIVMGKGTVTKLGDGNATYRKIGYLIEVTNIDTGDREYYRGDGCWFRDHKYPRLFKSPQEAAEYFANLEEEKMRETYWTDEKREEFIALSKPLIEWVRRNCHPHVKVIIENDHAELLSGEIGYTRRTFRGPCGNQRKIE